MFAKHKNIYTGPVSKSKILKFTEESPAKTGTLDPGLYIWLKDAISLYQCNQIN